MRVSRRAWDQVRRLVSGVGTCSAAAVLALSGGCSDAPGDAPDPAPDALTARVVAAGHGHTCVLTPRGAAYCWGSDSYGALGDGAAGGRSETPVAVAGGLTFTTVGTGATHACALTTAGAAYCWGDNMYGQLGDGTTTRRPTPTAVAGGLTFTQLAVGHFHTCGLTAAGAAYCWGSNERGRLGDRSMINRVVPTPVSGGLTFASLAAGGSTCGLTAEGAAYCWGRNVEGQLGSPGGDSFAPVAVEGAPAFASLSVGMSHACGLTRAGVAYCWGWNRFGQLGDGTASVAGRSTPAPVTGGHTFASLAAGALFTCGLTPGGEPRCWGYNNAGQLGGGSGAQYEATPVDVAGELRFVQLAAGETHACGRASDGALYCWGSNLDGQLGLGSISGSRTPRRVLPRP